MPPASSAASSPTAGLSTTVGPSVGATPSASPAAPAAPISPRDAPAAAEPGVAGAQGTPAVRSSGGKPTPNEVQLTQRVLADLQRQIDLMLEVRLREALAPLLARATDTLVRDARKELTAAMRDIVAKAIAKELGRREDR